MLVLVLESDWLRRNLEVWITSISMGTVHRLFHSARSRQAAFLSTCINGGGQKSTIIF